MEERVKTFYISVTLILYHAIPNFIIIMIIIIIITLFYEGSLLKNIMHENNSMMNYLFRIRPSVNTESYKILAYKYYRSHMHTSMITHSRTHARSHTLSLSCAQKSDIHIDYKLRKNYFNN